MAQEVLRTHTTAHWIFVLKQHRTIANLLFALSAVMPTTAWCIWLNKCFKTEQDYRQIFVCCFWLPWCPKMHLSDPKVNQVCVQKLCSCIWLNEVLAQ